MPGGNSPTGGLGRGIPGQAGLRTQDTMPGPCPGQPGGPLGQPSLPQGQEESPQPFSPQVVKWWTFWGFLPLRVSLSPLLLPLAGPSCPPEGCSILNEWRADLTGLCKEYAASGGISGKWEGIYRRNRPGGGPDAVPRLLERPSLVPSFLTSLNILELSVQD